MGILLDTNLVIGHIERGIIQEELIDEDFFISVITEAELLRLPGLSEWDERVMNDFLGECERIPVTIAIARRAAILGRTRKTKLPDLLIAATAIEYGLRLVTRNAKDFRKIPGLNLAKLV